MKKIIYIFLLSFIFNACDEDELNLQSTSKLPAAKVFETEAGTKAALVGLYYSLAQPDDNGRGSYWACHLPLMNEIRGEDVIANNDCWYSTYIDVHQFNVQDDWGFIEDLWVDAYGAIEVANSIIEAKMPFDENKVKNFKAQARAIRALIYYDIISFFGRSYSDGDGNNPGVCLITKTDYNYNPKRSTVKECYDFIVSELEAIAEDLNPIAETNAVEANKNFAYGLLARAYLDIVGTKKDLALLGKIKGFANKALEGISIMPANEFKKGLSNISSEAIFVYSITESSYSKWRSFTGFWDDWDGMGKDIRVTKEMFNRYADGDLRKDFFWPEFFAAMSPEKWTSELSTTITDARDLKNFDPNIWGFTDKYYLYGKFPRKDFVGDYTGYSVRGRTGLGTYTYMRASEMVLIVAECEARLDNFSIAATELLKIQQRALPSAVKSIKTGNDLVEEIYLEYRKELLGEGRRFRDILRLKKNVVHNGVSHWDKKTIEFSSNKIIWPIPQSEIDSNSSLTDADQNPGY